MMKRSRVAARPSPMIGGVFLVCHITKHFRLGGEVCFTLVLAARTRRYIAITGKSGTHVSVGDLVWVKGCVLRCGGQPVIVANSLDRITRSRSSVPCWQLGTADLKETVGR